ncbi:YtpR family tRNA-binding protein [Spiroplasma taiwanense]|uniref:Putative tRNA-binding protein n=1 Tax=Spiroplasma taiwanense CT-1 TaxID=1276220 RepID=S5MI47_9MOLU|nr:tRNA-binding protein [Spiroplasma taiwanense]AGR41565.1 putative tRNA-binding protein [Spiroplasma taiwanense CT-1]
MKLFLKYVKQFNTLIISMEQKNITSTKREENVEILFNGDEIVGFNVFEIKLENKKFNLEDSKLKEIAYPILQKYFKNFKFENQFIIVKIIDFEKIQNTHLSLCKINTGKEVIQIVCGADNVKKEMLTVLATIGSWMPNGMRINQGKLKGFDSYGMLCSAKELEITNSNFNTEGILELKIDDSKIGRSIWEII